MLNVIDYPWDDRKLHLGTLTRGCRLQNDRLQCRLPIRKPLLETLLFEVNRMYHNQPYLCILYQSILLLAYYGLMRIGELTEAEGQHVVKTGNIHVGKNKNKILIILYSSKMDLRAVYPQQIKISSVHQHGSMNKDGTNLGRGNYHRVNFFCPFKTVRKFIDLQQGNFTDLDQNFFIFRDGMLVKPHHVRNVLKSCLTKLNLDPTLYNCHSTRISRASDLLKDGMPVEQIKRIGCWRSNTIYKYLRY